MSRIIDESFLELARWLNSQGISHTLYSQEALFEYRDFINKFIGRKQ
jgi:hypothetical protein